MIKIRRGTKEDLPKVLGLVLELAAFEKAEEEVTNTIAKMERDGFGKKPVFGFIVAEDNGRIIGLSVYYWRYSTWKGKRIYLEDLIITELYRSQGIGTRLFEETMTIGKEEGASGMMWQVLDWNTEAIKFYKKFNPTFDGGWVNGNIDF